MLFWGLFCDDTLVNVYATCGNMEFAQKMLDRLPQRNVFGWTGLTTGSLGFAIEAFGRIGE